MEGTMSDINMKLSQTQFQILLDLSKSIPAVFAGDPADDAEVIAEVPVDDNAKAIVVQKQKIENTESSVHLNPELGTSSETWSKLDLMFKMGNISLELLFCKPDQPIEDIDNASLSKFSLNKTDVKLRMISDGSIESEILIKSFTINDSRRQETNKFRKIMSSTNTDGSQFMASITISGGIEKNLIAMLTIDSPRIIFALDYLFALKDFVMAGLEPPEDENSFELDLPSAEDSGAEESSQYTDEDDDMVSATSSHKHKAIREGENKEGQMNMSFRVNVVDAQVILIANPGSTASEAIVLGTKQVLVAQQHALTLEVTKVGMFLCRMDKFDTTRLRILDDFGLKVSMESRAVGTGQNITNIGMDIEPLVLRVSLRDIMLAMQIINKASELSDKPDTSDNDAPPKRLEPPSGSTLKRRTPSGKATSTLRKTTKSVVDTNALKVQGLPVVQRSSILNKEELKANIEGLRIILIGDAHELPLLDVSIKHFTARLGDWSAEMTGDTNLELFINVYNFSKSAWEPLIEPWQLGFHMSRTVTPSQMTIELFSRKMLELTITSQSIALASKAAHFLSQSDDVLSKPRGVDSPYRIRNQTGFPIHVWSDSEDSQGNTMAKRLEDGEEVPWRFEEWEKMRENLNPDGASGKVGVKLEETDFESIKQIQVNREGEDIYTLRPRKEKVLHRLLCEVQLAQDNVKYITFRSPLLVENNTQIPVELGILDESREHVIKLYKIQPGESSPAPVEAAYYTHLVVRPDAGFGYSWCQTQIHWSDLLKQPTKILACNAENEERPPFYFQMHANFDRSDPFTKVYPYMKIKLSAPLEIQNLLPYDFKYRIYDKNTKKDWTNFLRKGGLSPVHVVELSHLLLMSVDMQDTVFNQSEFSIINSNNTDEFKRESTLVAKDKDGLTLKLKLHYFPIPDSGGAFRVSVYSPFLILNKTGLDIVIKSKSSLQQAKPAAGQAPSDGSTKKKAVPYMFSYPSDDRRNRALLKVGDSNWSRPVSFEAIGNIDDVVLTSSTKQTEIHVGVSVSEGEGKYKMTKVVSLTPRFILNSKLSEDINIREPESSNVMTLKPGELLPLHFLRQTSEKQLTFCFPGINNQWSSPFNISDLGTVHVKLSKTGQRQRLLKVEILQEAATTFLHMSMETRNWPFSMRNESDIEFTFFQANPHIDDDDDSSPYQTQFRPIRYRLPPRSIMPYAWDFPAAKQKELIVSANGKDRHIRLSEIGNLVSYTSELRSTISISFQLRWIQIPMKIPAKTGTNQQKIIDINVAADGPTQTLVLSNYRQSRSLYKEKTNASQTSLSSASTREGFEVQEQDGDVTFKAQIRFAGIGISLINSHLKELAYITFRGLELKYNESKLYQTINVVVKWIQIDNQLYGGIFPILLYPSVVPKTGKEMDVHPSFHASVTRVKDDCKIFRHQIFPLIALTKLT